MASLFAGGSAFGLIYGGAGYNSRRLWVNARKDAS